MHKKIQIQSDSFSRMFRSLFFLVFSSLFLFPHVSSAQTCSFDGLVVDGKSTHYSRGTCGVYTDASCTSNKNRTSNDCSDPNKPACCGAVISVDITEGVSEQEAGIVPCGRIQGTDKEQAPCTLCHFIIGFKRIIDYILRILAYVAIACLVIAGIIYIVSAGNEKVISTAKGFIHNTLFGTAIVLLAWLAINVVITYFATKDDLGVGATGLRETGVFKFECDTASSALTGTTAGSGTNPGGDTNPGPEGTKDCTLDSVMISCDPSKKEASTSVQLDSDGSDKPKSHQLTAFAKYKCPGKEDEIKLVNDTATWKVADVSKATVDKGLVTALAPSANQNSDPFTTVTATFKDEKGTEKASDITVNIDFCPLPSTPPAQPTSQPTTCEACNSAPKTGCPLIYGQESNPVAVIFHPVNGSIMNDGNASNGYKYGPNANTGYQEWTEQNLTTFQEKFKENGMGVKFVDKYNFVQNTFRVYRSDVIQNVNLARDTDGGGISGSDNSACPSKEPRIDAYVFNENKLDANGVLASAAMSEGRLFTRFSPPNVGLSEDVVMAHELSHVIAKLVDEYWDSTGSYLSHAFPKDPYTSDDAYKAAFRVSPNCLNSRRSCKIKFPGAECVSGCNLHSVAFVRSTRASILNNVSGAGASDFSQSQKQAIEYSLNHNLAPYAGDVLTQQACDGAWDGWSEYDANNCKQVGNNGGVEVRLTRDAPTAIIRNNSELIMTSSVRIFEKFTDRDPVLSADSKDVNGQDYTEFLISDRFSLKVEWAFNNAEDITNGASSVAGNAIPTHPYIKFTLANIYPNENENEEHSYDMELFIKVNGAEKPLSIIPIHISL